MTSEWRCIEILLLILDLELKRYPCTKFEPDQANILPNLQVSSVFYSATHLLQKIAMATLEVNENRHHVQNDLHRCKIKLEKFNVDILWCYRVIKKSLSGGGGANPPLPGEIGLSNKVGPDSKIFMAKILTLKDLMSKWLSIICSFGECKSQVSIEASWQCC